MNVENILKVADAIEIRAVPGLGFNMSSFYADGLPDMSAHYCGTTACIAGWAVAIMKGDASGAWGTPDSVIGNWLGIDSSRTDQLFYALDHEAPEFAFERVTPKQAVSVLRHLAATGEVDWSIPLPEGE